MNKYYQLLWAGDRPRVGFAESAEQEAELESCRRGVWVPSFSLPERGRIENWQLKEARLKGGGYGDYMASSFSTRMCSGKLRAIFDRLAAPDDVLQWLEVLVHHGEETRSYWLLHFPEPPDVLDL